MYLTSSVLSLGAILYHAHFFINMIFNLLYFLKKLPNCFDSLEDMKISWNVFLIRGQNCTEGPHIRRILGLQKTVLRKNPISGAVGGPLLKVRLHQKQIGAVDSPKKRTNDFFFFLLYSPEILETWNWNLKFWVFPDCANLLSDL